MRALIDTWLTLPPADTSLLRRHGISSLAACLVGGVCTASDGRWIVPAYRDPPSAYHMVAEPLLIDLLTFDPAQPDRWTLHRGDAVMLGEAVLREAQHFAEPLPIYGNPLNWLRAGGIGAMPIDMPAFAQAVLWTPALELIVRDLQHGLGIERATDRATKIDKPIISVEVLEDA